MPALRIGFLLFPRLTTLDLVGAHEVLSRLPRAEVHLLARDLTLVGSETGIVLAPTAQLQRAPQLDVLCVPGGPGVNALLCDDETLDAVAAIARGAKLVTSVCTGALVLGAAGVLRGKRATTHWLSLDLLPLFGATPVAERVVRDGDLVTGGGITAGVDLGLALAADLAGERTARELALLLEYDPAPPFPGSPRTAAAGDVAGLTSARAGLQQERRALCEAVARRRKIA
jgi:cyclohexyl-isocyanide hydratase